MGQQVCVPGRLADRYRAATTPRRELASPCLNCSDKPCVSALSGRRLVRRAWRARYRLDAGFARLPRPPAAAWAACADRRPARNACPVGERYRWRRSPDPLPLSAVAALHPQALLNRVCARAGAAPGDDFCSQYEGPGAASLAIANERADNRTMNESLKTLPLAPPSASCRWPPHAGQSGPARLQRDDGYPGRESPRRWRSRAAT